MHRGGRFLIKKRKGEKTYEFSSLADLHALSALYTDNIGRKTIDAVAGHDVNVLANKSPVQVVPLPRMTNEASLGQGIAREVGDESLRAGFLNATSLHKHMGMFANISQLLALSTIFSAWLSCVPVDSMFAQIDGYSVLCQDMNMHGGSIALYIRNEFKATLLCSSSTETIGKP